MVLLFPQIKTLLGVGSFGGGNLFLIVSFYDHCLLHNENTPMQYIEKNGCKNENFRWKKNNIFLIFAQNIDCGYTLEPPRRGGSNEYPQSMF